jgi:hypothetical protein
MNSHLVLVYYSLNVQLNCICQYLKFLYQCSINETGLYLGFIVLALSSQCCVRPIEQFFFIHMCIQCLGHFSPLPLPHPSIEQFKVFLLYAWRKLESIPNSFGRKKLGWCWGPDSGPQAC